MGRLLNNSLFILIVFFAMSCNQTKKVVVTCNTNKVHFNIDALNKEGKSPKTNQFIEYEFCVPDNEKTLNEVMQINPSLKTMKSKGRSGCGSLQLLVLGNTDNKDFKGMLCKIANLDYVKEVNQTFWE